MQLVARIQNEQKITKKNKKFISIFVAPLSPSMNMIRKQNIKKKISR